MAIRTFKEHDFIEDLNNALNLLIEDNHLVVNKRELASAGMGPSDTYLEIAIYRRDPDYYQVADPNCPSNEEASELVQQLIDRFKHRVKRISCYLQFSYSIDETWFSTIDQKELNEIKSDVLVLDKVDGIEDRIRKELPLQNSDRDFVPSLTDSHPPFFIVN